MRQGSFFPSLLERRRRIDRALYALAIELWRSALPEYRPTCIRRDFHRGNVLWSRRRLTGIVDWPAACRGPIGCEPIRPGGRAILAAG